MCEGTRENSGKETRSRASPFTSRRRRRHGRDLPSDDIAYGRETPYL
jgi:hypothetical protein